MIMSALLWLCLPCSDYVGPDMIMSAQLDFVDPWPCCDYVGPAVILLALLWLCWPWCCCDYVGPVVIMSALLQKGHYLSTCFYIQLYIRKILYNAF